MSLKKAKKEHNCDAAPWLIQHLDFNNHETEMTISELRAFIFHQRKGFVIEKGEIYFAAYGAGEPFRAIPKIHKICIRLNLYTN